MRISRLSTALALAFSFFVLSQAHATIVVGKAGNCAAIWDTSTASATPNSKGASLTCTDGDPTCDTDGQPNGTCSISLTACVGQTSDSCPTPAPITGALKFKSLIGGVPKRNVVLGFVPPAAGTCASASMGLALVRVPKNTSKPLKKLKPSKKVSLQLKAKGFLNALTVQCVPPGTVTTGAVCPPRTDGASLPNQITLQVPSTGSDLDNGWTGSSHNFPIIQGSTLKYCLSNCDGTSDTLCDGSGTTGDGSLNGPTFGAPLPLLASGVPVCVINRYQAQTVTSTFDLASGVGSSQINLFSDVYLTNNPGEVCPRCNPDTPTNTPEEQIGKRGKCSTTARAGVGTACTIEGQVKVTLGAGNQQYFLSSACIPSQSQNTASLDIRLPLTTGEAPPLVGPLPCPDSAGPQTSDDACGAGGTCTEGACTGTSCVSGSGTSCIDSKGGISQACCSSNTQTPCFNTRGGGSITRTGTPIPASGQGTFAATFCIARTNSSLINGVTGLPGPGALLLPSVRTVTCGGSPCP